LWASKPPVVHVLGETWTLLNRRCGHRAAIAPLPSDTAPVRVEHIPQSWRNSFVDATDFALLCDKNDPTPMRSTALSAQPDSSS
jgi:hypothetical protein